jgi:hypothetical protein
VYALAINEYDVMPGLVPGIFVVAYECGDPADDVLAPASMHKPSLPATNAKCLRMEAKRRLVRRSSTSEGRSNPSIRYAARWIAPPSLKLRRTSRFARNDVDGSVRKYLTTFTQLASLTPRNHGSRIRTARNFFIIFVDGIFTTFIAGLFTNTSHAIRETSAISCV